MAKSPSITHLRHGATALTTEAGKLVRDRALNAAHQALVLALQSVQAADRKLRGAASPRRKTVRRGRSASTKRKAAPPAAKSRRGAVSAARRGKSIGRGGRRAR